MASLSVVLLATLGLFTVFQAGPPPLRTSGVAILLAQGPGEDTGRYGQGFVSSLTRAVKDIAERETLVGQVIPYDDVIQSGVNTWQDVGGRLGVDYAIVMQPKPSATTAEIKLVASKSRRIIEQREIVFGQGPLEAVFEAAVTAMVDVLGYPSDKPLKVIGPYAPAEPGAFEFYSRAMGLVREQTEDGLEEGIKMLERAVELSPQFARAYAGLAEAYLNLSIMRSDVGLVEKAKRFCDEAIALDPDLLAAHITMTWLHIRTGMYGQARYTIEDVLAKNPSSVEALLAAGKIYEEMGQFEQSESMYLSAIRLQPDYWNAYGELGKYYLHRARYDEAGQQFQHMIDLAPQSPIGYLGKGASDFFQEQYSLAASSWQKGLEITGQENFALTNNIATAWFYAHDFEKAADAFKKALEMSEGDYRVWGNLGTSLLWAGANRGEYVAAKTRAIELAEQELSVNPHDDQVRAKLGAYHAEMGDTTGALEYLTFFQFPPDSALPAETVFEVGAAWEDIGERSRAIDWIREALLRHYTTTELDNYPGLDSLRQDPRFQSMFESIQEKGLEPVG